jgi:hypothetical protein
MTLGCGSWGGNVTSDNISPLHLMDIKRVAFETRAVPSKRPARAGETSQAASVQMNAPAPQPAATAAQGGRINREEVAAIVDRFLAGRDAGRQGAPALHTELHASSSPPPAQPVNEINPSWMDAKSSAAPHAEAAPTAREGNGGNGHAAAQQPPTTPAQTKPAATGNGGAQTPTNGHKAVDFVSEDDVRRAVQKGEKIYVNAKTIITPSARDIGDPAEVFAKV